MKHEWDALIRQQAGRHAQELSDATVDELAEHLDDLYAERLAGGATADEARRTAVEALAAAQLDAITDPRPARRPPALPPPLPSPDRWRLGIGRELRYAVRHVCRQPAPYGLIIATLAVGLAAATSVFAVVHAVLLRDLPYPEAGRIVMLARTARISQGIQLSAADWHDYAGRSRSFDAVAAYSSWNHNLTGDGEALRLRSLIVAGPFFGVLGITPLHGRPLTGDDDRPGAPTVVVLSHRLWVSRYAQDPAVIGRDIQLNGQTARIVGVMPADTGPPFDDVDLWVPIGMDAAMLENRAGEWLTAFGRLRRGVSIEHAEADLQAIGRDLESAHPQTNAGESVAVVPMREHVVRTAKRPLIVLAAAVLLVLVAACANAGQLLMAAFAGRRDEFAVRLALGASRDQLFRQSLAECLVVTATAAVAGGALAVACTRLYILLGADRIPRLASARVDASALALAAGVALLLGLAFALAGSMTATKAAGLTAAGRISTRLGVRPIFVAAQVAFAVVVATTALLLFQSYERLRAVDPGLHPEDVVTVRFTLSRARYPDGASHARFAGRATTLLASLPQVRAAGVVNDLPFAGNQSSFEVSLRDHPPGDRVRAGLRTADGGYFRALGIPTIAGRQFDEHDTATAEPVALVNRSAADRFWGGGAIGRHVRVGDEQRWRTVVGIVGDIRHLGLERDEGPVVYAPYAQKPFDFMNWLALVVRTTNAAQAAPIVKQRLAELDAHQPAYDLLPLDAYLARGLVPWRFNWSIMAGLGLTTLALAAAGINGMTVHIVGARRRELGIRLALGAPSGSVLRLVLRQVSIMTAAGLLTGLVLAALLARGLETMLFRTAPLDAPTFLIAAVMSVTIAMVSALVPARQVLRIDPVTTLKGG